MERSISNRLQKNTKTLFLWIIFELPISKRIQKLTFSLKNEEKSVRFEISRWTYVLKLEKKTKKNKLRVPGIIVFWKNGKNNFTHREGLTPPLNSTSRVDELLKIFFLIFKSSSTRLLEFRGVNPYLWLKFVFLVFLLFWAFWLSIVLFFAKNRSFFITSWHWDFPRKNKKKHKKVIFNALYFIEDFPKLIYFIDIIVFADRFSYAKIKLFLKVFLFELKYLKNNCVEKSYFSSA